MQRILAALLCLGVVGSARADIVWEGQTVPAWPEGAWDAPAPYAAKKFYPSPQGVVRGLTILVDFSDQAPAFDVKAIEAWLNERDYTGGGLKGSVRDYYLDVSNGKVDFQNEVVGFYRAKKTKAYYEGGSGYARSDELFAEVIASIDAEVDFSKFDNDGDGRTDSISLVYAGEAVKWGQGLWPHASGSSMRVDGVVLSRYMMSALSRKLALYTFVHEVGHMLFGWPDLYGFGDYCVMGNATNPVDPAGVNDFFRADQGWIPEITITREQNTAAVAPASGAGFRYTNPLDDGECFFWSNVQKDQGRWRVLRGSGLLFFHYKRSIRVNNPPNPLALAVVQADGRDDLGRTQWPSPGSDAKDFFFGGGVDSLAENTMPSSRWRDGTSSGLRVYDIGPSGREMQFKVGTGSITDAGVLRHDAGVLEDASVIGAVADAAVDAGRDAGVFMDLDATPQAPAARDASVDARVVDARVVETPSEAREDDGGCTLGGHARFEALWLALIVMKLRRRKTTH